jgi:hypothetical protein
MFFNPLQKSVILSEAPRRSIAYKEFMARSRRTPAMLVAQMLFAAFRPRTPREIKKVTASLVEWQPIVDVTVCAVQHITSISGAGRRQSAHAAPAAWQTRGGESLQTEPTPYVDSTRSLPRCIGALGRPGRRFLPGRSAHAVPRARTRCSA